MKKWLYVIGISCVILLLAGSIFAFQQKEIKVVRVYGYGLSPNGYSILTSLGGASTIPCTYEQYHTLNDDSYTNVSYSVIYEQNRWFKNNQHTLKLLRFERPFPNDQNKQVQSFYYRLIDETLEQVNDNTSVLTRLYEKRENNNNLFDVIPQSVVISRVGNVKQARQWVQKHHPEFLQLMDETVIDDSVLGSWKRDDYQQVYSTASPEGLSLNDIISMHRDNVTGQ
ncbi:hypothetical protein Back11_61950 [Paenibacillus baekrokdamisoli]|uniref:Uncharacterized protein n=1 Tax=Paenibacillus baekrokdamisoli TaxID=1712516 RepID=A0A3G9J0Z9_9BACL|nr:hypothetical protein [Paenibacillus baekrokdamisoli]MBB3072267.1 hypothetical protein [Paenibacillus baekrokdamisoli]BBH24850.1 hypothetical protein Back11_61950 [Paenibacillus baekrokdamisoli]